MRKREEKEREVERGCGILYRVDTDEFQRRTP
jgi:hypothetical protein